SRKKPAAMLATRAGAPGAATTAIAPAPADSRRSAPISKSTTQAIGQSTSPPAVGDKAATPAPARASGVTTTDTTGIAKAFASGPTRLTDAKNTAPSGNMATLAAHCVATAWRHQAG